MSIETMTAVLSARIGDSTSKLVLLAYANHAAKDGTAAWPGKAAVAEYAECDPKTVQRHLRKLEASGWLRRGDQELVSHLRADRRPVVYDVAMTPETAAAWAAAPVETDARREDNLSPRPSTDGSTPVESHAGRQDNMSPRPTGHGGTSETPRGDTAMSPKPSKNQYPPTPTADAAGEPATTAHAPAGCPAHPAGQANCRACGTTPRQLAAAAQADKAARVRARNDTAVEQARAGRSRRLDPTTNAAHANTARTTIAAALEATRR